MKKDYKRDCKFFDWGDTAPREYGVFCRRTKDHTSPERCSNCKSYMKKVATYGK